MIGVVGLLARRHPRQAASRHPRSASGFTLSRDAVDRRDGGLRIHRLRAAGLDAALPARLPQLVHEDRHDRVPGDRRRRGESGAEDAGVHASSPRGGGPIIPGPLFPFVFITIACGAISGFHALIASGTTPKMIDKETDIRPIGYGAMLIEGLVGVVALIAATALFPGDYFAINTARRPTFADARHAQSVNLPQLEAAVGETVAGRTGRRGVAGRRHGPDLQRPAGHARPDGLLVPLRDHVRGALHPDDDRHRHARGALPGAGVPRPLLCADGDGRTGCPARSSPRCSSSCAWAYFIWTGSIGTIWPMFGIANQLLAAVALAVATTIIINTGQGALRVGHARAARVRLDHDADRRRAERPRQLLADGDRTECRATFPGLHEHESHRHHDGVRRRDPRQRHVEMDPGAHRSSAASSRTTCCATAPELSINPPQFTARSPSRCIVRRPAEHSGDVSGGLPVDLTSGV